MKDSMMRKKYTSQIGEKISNSGEGEYDFLEFDSVRMNESIMWI